MGWLVAFLGSVTVVCGTSLALANDWPSKPIRIIVSFTAGSATDILARLVFQEVSSGTGQSVVIENRGGAGGTIGAAAVARSAPDGYTMLVNAAGHAAAPWVYPNLTYDTAKDFAGVTPLANIPNVLVVSPSSRFTKVDDIISAARSRPGTITYASAGVGTAGHLNSERFRLKAKFEGVHVPFRGAPEAITEIMAERLDFLWVPITPALSAIRDGKLRPLAVSTDKRSSALPDIPSTVELGLPDSSYNFWVGLFLPAKTPGY